MEGETEIREPAAEGCETPAWHEGHTGWLGWLEMCFSKAGAGYGEGMAVEVGEARRER